MRLSDLANTFRRWTTRVPADLPEIKDNLPMTGMEMDRARFDRISTQEDWELKEKLLARTLGAYEAQRRHCVYELGAASSKGFMNDFFRELFGTESYKEARIDICNGNRLGRERIDAVIELIHEAQANPDMQYLFTRIREQAHNPAEPGYRHVGYAAKEVGSIHLALETASRELGSHYPRPVEHMAHRYHAPSAYGLKPAA